MNIMHKDSLGAEALMSSAGDAGIEGADDPAGDDGFQIRVGDRGADQGGFDRPPVALIVFWGEVPRRRGDDVIFVDLLVFDPGGMKEGAPHGISDRDGFLGDQFFVLVQRRLARFDGVEPLLYQLSDERGFQRPGGNAVHD